MPVRLQPIGTLLALLALASALTARAETPASYMDLTQPRLPETVRGVAAVNAGKYAEASVAFNDALKKNPQEGWALAGLAQLAIANNEFQAGLDLYVRAIQAFKSRPEAELFVDALWSLLPSCKDPAPFLDLVKQATAGDGFRPYVRDLLQAKHAYWLMQRGDYDGAVKAHAPLQPVNAWAFIGPFDNRDKAGFNQVNVPETEIDFEKPLQGRGRSVNWFFPQAAPYDGRVNLSSVFEPKIHVYAYAVTFVKAEKSGPAVLRAGCGGALRAWVNGKPVGAVETYNDFGQDKLVAPIYLSEGWNLLLLKSAVVEETDWVLSVRISGPDGGAMLGLTFDATPAALAAYRAKSAPATPAVADAKIDLGLLPLLAEHLKAHPDDVDAWIGSAMLQNVRKIGDKDNPAAVQSLERALALTPSNPGARLSLAITTDDNNQARQAAEAVMATHPDLPVTWEVLALLAQSNRLPVMAEDYARQAIAKFGIAKSGLAPLVLADVLSGSQSPSPGDAEGRSQRAEAYRLFSEFVASHPYNPDAWERLIDLEMTESGRAATVEKALKFNGGEESLRRRRATALIWRGRDSEAVEILAQGLRARPYSLSQALAVASQYRRSGNIPGSTKVLEDALKWAPESPDLLAALAQDRHASGQTPEAVKLLKDALRFKPNWPYVKDYLAQLDDGRAIDRAFFAPYDIALKDLSIPDAAAYPDDNAVQLLNQEVVRVNANGSTSRMIHSISKLLRPGGVGELNQHYIYYEPDRQVVDILKASVITPDGRELSRAEISDRSTSAAMGVETRIYDEHHLKHVVFKNLEPGCIIDLQYTIRDFGENIYGDYVADTFHFSDGKPTIRSQYILDHPKTIAIQTRAFNSNVQLQRPGSKDEKREILKWETEKLAGVPRERGMPPVVDGLPQLQITTMKSWTEVGEWYWHLAREQLVVNDEMKKTIQEITRDAKTDTEKLRAIHDWTIRKIRYLGIEFGRNGYKPHKATESFKALYGDCKDTSTLISALLNSIGIDSRLVLIRTVDAGAVPPDSLPMPNLFNHCIAYVPNVDGKDYWIDGTTDFHRLGEVPHADRGAQVLVVEPNGGKFMKIPIATSTENLTEQNIEITLAPSGGGTVKMHDVKHGQLAPVYREFIETPGRYDRYLREFAAKRFIGGEVVKWSTANSTDQGPMWMQTEFKVDRLTSAAGDRMALPSSFEPVNLSTRYASDTKRRFDLDLNFPWLRKTKIAVNLDPALKVVSKPDEAAINEPFGRFIRTVKTAGQMLLIEETLELSQERIPVAQYDAFKAFCNRVDSLLEQKTLLGR